MIHLPYPGNMFALHQSNPISPPKAHSLSTLDLTQAEPPTTTSSTTISTVNSMLETPSSNPTSDSRQLRPRKALDMTEDDIQVPERKKRKDDEDYLVSLKKKKTKKVVKPKTETKLDKQIKQEVKGPESLPELRSDSESREGSDSPPLPLILLQPAPVSKVCTHLRKTFNLATYVHFDEQGLVSHPPFAREMLRESGLKCIRNVMSPRKCRMLFEEIMELRKESDANVTSWRGLGGGGPSQKFIWCTEPQLRRFGKKYHFDRHKPLDPSVHMKDLEQIHRRFGREFNGPVIALQPNFQQADFPMHTDRPDLEGFGNKIITLGVVGKGWIVVRDQSGRFAFKFEVNTGDAWGMVGEARWNWAHGVLCEAYDDTDDPEDRNSEKSVRVSLNIRCE